MLGFVAALFMGVSLGLLGGGGGILTVPILVFAYGIPATQATGLSLLIVGATSFFGAIREYLAKKLDVRLTLEMALPAMVGAFSARKWLLPAVPDPIIVAEWSMEKDRVLLGIFGVIMLIVAWRMLVPPPSEEATSAIPIWLLGLVIGAISGILGAGGGFLIVPALILANGVDAKTAASSSLAIIAIQSLFGYVGEIGRPIPLEVLLQMLSGSLIGMFAGLALRPQVSDTHLKKGFAIFVILVGLWTLSKVWA